MAVVCIGPSGHSFKFITCHCLNGKNIYPLRCVSFVLTPPLIQLLLVCLRLISPSSGVVFTDPSGLELIVCSL